ncbi:hypothetical protein DFH06DRAFT_1349468 [Mycena polygramma]|nr:hypothetical protein DFH06DRAFT_1349468 [Mycena polygramma]
MLQFNVAVITTALLASASLGMSANITTFPGVNCTGAGARSINAPADECTNFGGSSPQSISYSGVPNQILFYEFTPLNNECLGGATLVRGGGSGCATAPAGEGWWSVAVT